MEKTANDSGDAALLQKIKLFTHEAIVHAQLAAIERTLNRSINYEVTLNSRGIRSSILFEANQQEINMIKANLGYTVMILDGTRWLPSI